MHYTVTQFTQYELNCIAEYDWRQSVSSEFELRVLWLAAPVLHVHHIISTRHGGHGARATVD